MNIATKNIEGILKTLEELRNEEYTHISTCVTKNYNTYCYSYTLINDVIEDVKNYGKINLNGKGIWDSKKNQEYTKDYKCIYTIYQIYQTARERNYIK